MEQTKYQVTMSDIRECHGDSENSRIRDILMKERVGNENEKQVIFQEALSTNYEGFPGHSRQKKQHT